MTPAEGRRFGLTVGGAFVVLALISRWRGHDVAPSVLGSLGGVLLLGALVAPGWLGPVHRGWMSLGLLLSKVTTPLFMGLLYFVVFAPVGLVMRLFGRNPLRHGATNGSYWAPRSGPTDPDSLRRQF